MLSSSQMITSNEKEHVVILPDDKINVIVHQMITPNERSMLSPSQIVISVLYSSQMITSMVSSLQMIYLVLLQLDNNSDRKGEYYHPAK
jgi:hypothetical protein